MSLTFNVFGPFDVNYKPLKGHLKIITKKEIGVFFQGDAKKHAMKNGCYIFALKHGPGSKPWYVGKTKRDFLSEAFTSDKVNRYNEVITEERGAPIMFFIAPNKNLTDSKKHLNILDEIEGYLISRAFKKNPELKNFTKTQPKWIISGVVNSKGSKASREETDFKNMIGIE